MVILVSCSNIHFKFWVVKDGKTLKKGLNYDKLLNIVMNVQSSETMSYPYRSKTLDRLGVRSWINANNWSTVIGGTWISDHVLEAMNEVAKTFVDMFELIAVADERIAKLCKVEDAHVTTGAGAAIALSVAGCRPDIPVGSQPG